jgi:hypothetical protein
VSTPSLRRQLTLTSVVVLTTAMAAMGWAFLLAVHDAVWTQHDQALLDRARALAAFVEYDEGKFELDGQLIDATSFRIWRPDGTVLAHSGRSQAGELPGLRPLSERRVSRTSRCRAESRAGW